MNSGEMNGVQPTSSGVKNYSMESAWARDAQGQPQTTKSDSGGFFSCCSSEADKQRYETDIFSGVDLKPIKRTKASGDFE